MNASEFLRVLQDLVLKSDGRADDELLAHVYDVVGALPVETASLFTEELKEMNLQRSYRSIQVVDIACQRLLQSDIIDVVFFGEANFTFCTALAGVRQSCDGIIGTKYEKSPTVSLQKSIRICIEELVNPTSDFFWCKPESNRLCSIRRLVELRDSFMIRSNDVDATHFNHPPKTSDFFFQCPWVGQGDKTYSTALLIQHFIREAAANQHKGYFVFVGITTYYPFCLDYGLEVLCFSRGSPARRFYRFVGIDRSFPMILLSHGYVHEGFSRIHHKIATYHVTLCFERM